MLRKGLASEFRWFAVYLIALLIVGYSLELLLETLLLGLTLYIAWLYYNLSLLESWMTKVRHGKRSPNHFNGIWGEIADDVTLLCNRYEKDKLRLQAVVTRVQDITSALTDAVILLDKDTNIEWWNKAAEHLFLFREIDLGHRVSNIIRHPRFQRYLRQGDYSEPIEIESVRQTDQTLQFEIYTFGDDEMLMVVRDVTRVIKLEQMRRDFVANVSHELRTPLTVIRGYVETLLDMPKQTPILKKALGQMHTQGQRMTSLVQDLIALTKLETDEGKVHEPLNLHDLTEQSLNDAKAFSEDGKHSFILKVDQGIQLLGNEDELRSAFSNLAVNAVKYSPNGAEIEIKASIRRSNLIVHVRDTGPGIDSSHIPRLTERFYRVDSGRASGMGGTGLGLAIVKHVLVRHDAHLRIKSVLGSGSTFRCYFPVSRVSSAIDLASKKAEAI